MWHRGLSTRNAPSQDNASGDHYGGVSTIGYVHDVNDDNNDMRRKSADDVAVCCAVRRMSMHDCSVDSPTMRTSRRSSSGSGVVPLRHLRHVPPQTVWRLWLIVYRTELKVSLCA